MAIIHLQTSIATAPLDVTRIMQLVADRATTLTLATGACIEMLDGSDLRYAAVSGALSPLLDFLIPRRGSLSGRCVDERAVLHARDTASDPRVNHAACLRVGAVSMICVPLFHGEDVIGVLKVISDRVDHFTDEDTATLSMLGDIIAALLVHAQQYEVARHACDHDGLTGLANRRRFDSVLANELARHRRYDHPLSIVTIDLDGFKSLNDRHGHAEGDTALRDVAAILGSQLRACDKAFRLGGDEFALVLPDTAAQGARVCAVRAAFAIERARIGHGLIGVSFGIAEAGNETALELCARSDRAMYAHKQARRTSR